MSINTKPVVLIIRDGWGSSEEKEGNAILNAETPVNDLLLEQCPHSKLRASGEAVGLPEGFVGNSEVGHITIGSGRIVKSALTRINEAIDTGKFLTNSAFERAVKNCKKNNTKLHLMGLLSDAGVHGMNLHLYSLLKLCLLHEFQDVCLHIFTDGHDCERFSAEKYIVELQQVIDAYGVGKICTVIGRHYSMDRDNRWERTHRAYEAVASGKGRKANTAIEAVKIAYSEEITEEFVEPTIIGDYEGVKDGDSVIFYNYRLDRARQLTKAFIDSGFDSFPRTKKKILFVCMCEYYSAIEDIENAFVAFEFHKITNYLSEYLSSINLKQLKIAETEKYAHVTYFFNCENEEELKGEHRILIASAKVKSYDLSPRMGAEKITENAVREISKFDFTVINYANADEVGHTGNFAATIEAVEFEDECIGRVLEEVRKLGGFAIIVSDHGNAERMLDANGNGYGGHTLSEVDMIVYNSGEEISLNNGNLYDVAPTILDLMNLERPLEMTGLSLVVRKG